MAYSGRHMLREYAGGSVGGILRKTQNTNNNNGLHAYSSSAVGGIALKSNNNSNNNGEQRQLDLLVFGYACKVFRDDDKARDIDQGKHLIPWMGDANLKIDRYDVRGALYELAPYEAPPGGYGNRLEYLSADEQRAEQLCEEERYMYLYNNEDEHILQQEEEMKRLKQATSGSSYNQVSFQYDESAPQHGPNPPEPTEEAAEQAFVLPRNFEVPANIQLPETMKQHAIIEKTARFIASQGMQMEILLKAKQSNNVQFEFLTQNSSLNAYYKHMLNTLKEGKYPAEIVTETVSAENNELADATVNTDAVDAESSSSSVIIPTIKYQPSENCAYTQLISKIKGVPLQTVIDDSVREQAKMSAQSSAVNANDGSPQVEILQNSSALALAQNYYSDTESEDENAQQTQKMKEEQEKLAEAQLQFPIPTDGLKNIIDKTATYVIKNGRKFEETLRNKSEERFTFLLPDNEFYAYYLYKVTGDPAAASKEQKTRKAAAVAAALLSRKGLISDKNTSPTPVSFTLRQKEEIPATHLYPALPQDFSDNEEEQQTEAFTTRAQTISGVGMPSVPRQMPEQVQKAIQLVESQLMARNSQLSCVAPLQIATCANSTKPLAVKQQQHNNKAEQERNALFEQQQQHRQKEMKRAEERVKDKLAQIAREKLCGLISKEKQLQLERKRKAMAFLNQIKGSSPQSKEGETAPAVGQTTSTEAQAINYGSDSDVSVHSIPITSFGPEDEDEETVVCNEEQVANAAFVNYIHNAESPTTAKAAFKQRQSEVTVTLVSDDDDVQLVSETRPQKLTSREHRSRSRSRDYRRQRRSKKTRSNSTERHDKHKKKKKKSKKHEHSRSRSHSRTRSRSRHSTWQRSHARAESSSEESDKDHRNEERKRRRQKN